MRKHFFRPGISVMAAICLFMFGRGEASARMDCQEVLRMHGFLRWSFGQCAYKQYNPEVVEDAKRCFEQLGSSAAAPLMYAGREQFERMVASQGREASCSEVARKFPMVVR